MINRTLEVKWRSEEVDERNTELQSQIRGMEQSREDDDVLTGVLKSF